MKTNEQILAASVAAYNSRPAGTPRVGDYLKLPYGLYTRFTHAHDESIQTGGGSDSYYLAEGGWCSYSGALDNGVKYSDIRPTDELRPGAIWFFDKGISGAHRAVHFEIDCRVYELIEGADTSGLPQIAKYEHQQFLKTVETITRINGNGHPYTLPLPELVIKNLNYAPFLDELEQVSGLRFKPHFMGYSAQPMTHEQMSKVMLSHNFKTTFYNNSTFTNTMVLDIMA